MSNHLKLIYSATEEVSCNNEPGDDRLSISPPTMVELDDIIADEGTSISELVGRILTHVDDVPESNMLPQLRIATDFSVSPADVDLRQFPEVELLALELNLTTHDVAVSALRYFIWRHKQSQSNSHMIKNNVFSLDDYRRDNVQANF